MDLRSVVHTYIFHTHLWRLSSQIIPPLFFQIKIYYLILSCFFYIKFRKSHTFTMNSYVWKHTDIHYLINVVIKTTIQICQKAEYVSLNSELYITLYIYTHTHKKLDFLYPSLQLLFANYYTSLLFSCVL